MTTIKLKHEAVMTQLDNVKRALDAIECPAPSDSSLGKNQLDFTSQWLERERDIHNMMLRYIEIVHKNVEDTRANVDLLKKQDEAITHK